MSRKKMKEKIKEEMTRRKENKKEVTRNKESEGKNKGSNDQKE